MFHLIFTEVPSPAAIKHGLRGQGRVERVDERVLFAATTLGVGRAHASFGWVMKNGFEERTKGHHVRHRGGLVQRAELVLAGFRHGNAPRGLCRDALPERQEEEEVVEEGGGGEHRLFQVTGPSDHF